MKYLYAAGHNYNDAIQIFFVSLYSFHVLHNLNLNGLLR
jgi:hypothetical protein